MEALVLAMLCLAPWAFGALAPEHRFFLDAGIATVMMLWGVRILLEGRLAWQRCPVVICLAAWSLVGLWQITPLPHGLLGGISPATAQIYERLLPARFETLPSGEAAGVSMPPAGSTLSLYPGSTRRELSGYLAILLLFAAVRQNIASSAGLRRLAVVSFVNGSLLALFGVVQALAAEPRTIYGIYPVPDGTDGFGPFINRNHFASYMNACLGLGAGLLLSRYPGRGRMPHSERSASAASIAERAHSGLVNRLLPMLDPPALGMVFALALMISSVFCSLSRGGFLSLMGGSILGLMMRPPRLRWSGQVRTVLLTVAIVLGLVSLLGYDRVVTRLSTLKGALMGGDGRWAIWSRALPLLGEFPLWGTGYGTYEFVGTLHRSTAGEASFIVDHAHNDYLEALVEGGLVLFLPVATAVVLVFRFSFRAVKQYRDGRVGGLVLGALMGLTAVAIHSLSDFGMHIPANAALVTVLCAHLCALGQKGVAAGPPVVSGREPEDLDRYVLRLGGLAPIFGGVAAAALGLALANEACKARMAQQVRLTASDRDESTDPAGRERKVAALEAAIRLVPEDARLHAELAHAHFTILRAGVNGLSGSARRTAAEEPEPPSDRVKTGRPDPAQQLDQHLISALRELLRSRDLCPVRAASHMEIAEHVHEFGAAEPQESYLDRAKFLGPDDPDLWERCGSAELRDGRRDQAWQSWRRSLELSPKYLPRILVKSAEVLDPADIVRRVVPDRPDLLLKAASDLYPQPAPGRRPFLDRALVLLEQQPDPMGASDLHVKGSIHRALGQRAEALAAYQAALDRDPLQLAWRYELAEVLYEQDKFQESVRELLKLQMLQPDNDQVRGLMDIVRGKIAEGR